MAMFYKSYHHLNLIQKHQKRFEKNQKQLKGLRSKIRREGQIVLRQEQRARMAWSGNG